MPVLSQSAIRDARESVPSWKCRSSTLVRTFEFEDFATAMRFVNRVARLAEKANHHPDIDIRWNEVKLALTTHDEGGLTAKDFAVARQCDRAAEAVGS
jgi:4a-hydroxytetrahydrobiopterin dehydratase